MTDREKAIVMAHTGICMLTGEKYGVFHAYIEDIMGRPVYTHELATQSISDKIKEKSRDDFIKLCMEEQEPCDDAISRQAALDKKELVELEDGQSFYCISPEDVETLPPVTPQPKIGHWRHYEGMLICSKCGSEFYDDIMEYCGDDVPKCCPDCGAKMIEPQESEIVT
jgi:hypothetical protein